MPLGGGVAPFSAAWLLASRQSFAIALVVGPWTGAVPAAADMRDRVSKSTPTGGFLAVLYHMHIRTSPLLSYPLGR
jgi:hypothetical protein